MSARPAFQLEDPVVCGWCGETVERCRVFRAIGVCDECGRKAAAAYSFARSGEHNPDFDPDADAKNAVLFAGRPRPKEPVPQGLRWEVFERDDFRCKHCGARRHLCADHIIPESKGGPTTTDNLQTLCRSCNSRKKDRLP